MKDWTKRNGLPSMPNTDISDLCHHLWSEHTKQITNHITKSSITQFQTTFDGAIFHCEDKQSSSLRIYCPCLYYQSIEQTFQDPSIFEQLSDDPTSIVASLVDTLQQKHGKAYPRIWQTTSIRLHSGKTKERLSEWLRGVGVPGDFFSDFPGIFFRIRGLYSKTHKARSGNHAERVRAPTFFQPGHFTIVCSACH